MKNGLVIADAGPIFSLAVINKLEVLDQLFDEVKIPTAVWEEVTQIKTTPCYKLIETYFEQKVNKIKGFINKLRPLFIILLENDRYYSLKLLNMILEQNNKPAILKA